MEIIKQYEKVGKQVGFTLIELMVVVAVVSILVGIATPKFEIFQKKTRDSARHLDVRTIMLAMDGYFLSYGEYPRTQGAALPHGGWASSLDASWDDLGTKLGVTLPKDPVNKGTQWFASNGSTEDFFYSALTSPGYADQKTYAIVYKLESLSNSENFNHELNTGVHLDTGYYRKWSAAITRGRGVFDSH